jgi:hypothetical protein
VICAARIKHATQIDGPGAHKAIIFFQEMISRETNTLLRRIVQRRLSELGFTKLVTEIDMKEAARVGLLGLNSKPLSSSNIEAHLRDFGLDPEFGVHSHIRGLSGGGALSVCLSSLGSTATSAGYRVGLHSLSIRMFVPPWNGDGEHPQAVGWQHSLSECLFVPPWNGDGEHPWKKVSYEWLPI